MKRRDRGGLRSFVLRTLPGCQLPNAGATVIACEHPKVPEVSDVDIAFECSASEDLVLTVFPKVSGTRFRRKPEEPEPEPPEQTALSPAQRSLLSQGVGNNTAAEQTGEVRPNVQSISHLYELLYPPAEDAQADISSFSELHDYQKIGVQFLLERVAALLADDMGLGKTAQCVVALAILFKQERIRRVLVICQKSIHRQWLAEAKRWGGLAGTMVNGPQHERLFAWRYGTGIQLVTPHLVLNDLEWLQEADFDIIVCDDVTMLKNPGQITTAIRSLQRKFSWCLNGTPLENKPEDLANVMEFVHPGLFSASERRYAPSQSSMAARVSPYFLRRKKTDYLQLPEKVSVGPILANLDGPQLESYRSAEAAEWAALKEAGIKVTKIHIFSVIRTLIRLCNFHPPSRTSAKLELLQEELEQVLSDPQNKAVVFAQDVEALKFLQQELSEYSPVLYYGGLTDAQRSEVLQSFSTTSNLLLGSVRACGRGLNLQHASYVFHFDRTWNPIDELQAEDRCWRLGQERTVLVYRYLLTGTVEERIAQVLARKMDLIHRYVDSQAQTPEQVEEVIASELTIEDLLEMVRPPPEEQL